MAACAGGLWSESYCSLPTGDWVFAEGSSGGQQWSVQLAKCREDEQWRRISGERQGKTQIAGCKGEEQRRGVRDLHKRRAGGLHQVEGSRGAAAADKGRGVASTQRSRGAAAAEKSRRAASTQRRRSG